MYQNLIRRPNTANRRKPLPIRLNAIPFNKQAAYVESVCAVLIESRFGPGRATPFVSDRGESPELELAVLYDLMPEGPLQCYTPGHEAARRDPKAMAMIKLKLHGPPGISIHGQKISPSTLGRGSPGNKIFSTQSSQRPQRKVNILFPRYVLHGDSWPLNVLSATSALKKSGTQDADKFFNRR